MTSESRMTIQLSDLKAIEFECTNCHHRLVRPIGVWQSNWDSCPDCGSIWSHYRHTMNFLAQFSSQVAKTKEIDNQNDSPYIVRFEITQPPKGQL
jgi:DNA replicative helicase MCM subunit Mcm2 (Cdc46/Mcm family)